MGKDSPAPPTPIDPTQTANAQADANIKAAQATAGLNRVDQSTPTGQVKWSQGPDGTWSQSTTLAPGQDNLNNWATADAANSLASLGRGEAGSLSYGTQAPTLQTSVNNPGVPVTSLNTSGVQAIPQADDAAYQKAVDSVYGQSTSRLDPQWAQQQTQLETQLANQGVPQNSDAWNKAMTQFTQGKNDAYTSAMNNAVTQGSALENTQFGMGLAANQAGEANAATEGNFANSAAAQQLAQALSTAGFGNTAAQQGFTNDQQNANLNNSSVQNKTQDLLATGGIGNNYSNIQMPGVAQSNVAAPDVLGANSLSAQQQMANYQNQTAQNSAKKGGTGSLLGTLGSAAILSDRRVKRDIEVIGEAPNGLPIYSFRYAWDDKKQVGLMAQDVEKIAPHAVITSGGIKHVDYGQALAA